MESILLANLTGPLDVRSPVEQLDPSAFRWKQNLEVDAKKRLRRVKGFRPAFWRPECEYTANYDLRNQGDPPPGGQRLPVTFTYSCRDYAGNFHLFAGTKRQIWKLNEQTGEWSPIFSGQLPGDDGNDFWPLSLCWRAAFLNNHVVFTNGHDPVFYHRLNDGQSGQIATLNTAGVNRNGTEGVPVSRAKIVVGWRGLLFLMDTVEGGDRFRSRIRWCDLNKPLEWRASVGDSVADFQDLDYDEDILGAAAIGDSMYVFTDKSIWRTQMAFDSQLNTLVMNAVKVYTDPRNRYRCLAYPRTLVSDGFNAYYLGADNIYIYNPYLAAPESPDWLNSFSGLIFNRFAIDASAPLAAVAQLSFGSSGRNGQASELHISWPTYDPPFALAEPPSCSTDPEDVKLTSPRGRGLNQHTIVVNLIDKTADYRDYGMLDYANHVWDARKEGDVMAAGPFLGGPMFLGASAADFCLKEIGVGDSRVFWEQNEGRHVERGYVSILRGPIPLPPSPRERMVAGVRVAIEPEVESDATTLRLSIGAAGAPYDPNEPDGNCRVIWHPLSQRTASCRRIVPPETMRALGIRQRPLADAVWAMFIRGRYLYYELAIGSEAHCAECKSGLAISSIEFSGRRA